MRVKTIQRAGEKAVGKATLRGPVGRSKKGDEMPRSIYSLNRDAPLIELDGIPGGEGQNSPDGFHDWTDDHKPYDI